MKNFYLVSCLFALISVSLAREVPFSEFGYDDIVLYGSTPVTTLFLKIGHGVDSSKSYIVLRIEPSPVLNFNESFLSIYILDKPAFSFRLSKTGGEILIPLKKFQLSPFEFLKIEIKASLAISDDRCKDIRTGALWIKILKNSYVYVERLPTDRGKVKIYNYFDLPLEQLSIVLPNLLSIAELEGAVWLYSFLKTKFEIKEIKFATFSDIPDTARNLIIISLFDKIPKIYRPGVTQEFLRSDGLLYVYNDGIGRNILLVTGFNEEGLRKAINALLSFDLINASFSSFLLVKAAPAPKRETQLSSTPLKISFKELGFSTGKVEGIGSLRSDFFFSLSRLGFSPTSLTMKISAVYSPISESIGKAFINVYFNNILIESKRLDESGKVEHKFSVNRFSLTKFNNLSIEFIFYPHSDDCKNKLVNFFYRIDEDNSYIEVDDLHRPEILDFTYFPQMFLSGETVCLIEPNVSLAKLEALAKIIYLVNSEAGNLNFYPKLITVNQVDDKVFEKYNIIAVLDLESGLMDKIENPVIRFRNGLKIISEPTGRVLYTLWDTSSIGIAQVFYGKNKNILLLVTGIGIYRDFLISKVVSVLEDRMATLKGNVGFVDLAGGRYFFEVGPGTLKVKYPGEKTLLDYFREYKLLVIIALWFLFLSVLVYVFFRGRAHANKVIK